MVIRDDALVRYLQVPLDSDFDRLFKGRCILLFRSSLREISFGVSMMVRSVGCMPCYTSENSWLFL